MSISLGEALAKTRDQLASIDSGRLDAELLVAFAAGTTRTQLFGWPERMLSPDASAHLCQLVSKRLAGVPLAYLTGERGFHALTLNVSPDVLIPRPETELLVDLALATHLDAGSRVLDAGCGSGAIALALKRQRPDWQIFASDISAPALDVARRNAAEQRLAVQFLLADWLDTFAAGSFDMVISNPPYIAEQDENVDPGLSFEPAMALYSGLDGLDAIRTLGKTRILAPGGRLLIEHGASQGRATRELMRGGNLTGIETHRDLAGHERVTFGRRL